MYLNFGGNEICGYFAITSVVSYNIENVVI
jgi:hypothetical protein